MCETESDSPKRLRNAWWFRYAMSALRVLAAVLVLGGVFIYFVSASVVFQPEAYPADGPGHPPNAPAGWEDVYLEAADGVRIHGYFVPSGGATCTLLYFHGNGGNLDYRRRWIRALASIPADVFAIDYRGYGRSEGTPSEAGVYLDGEAAYTYLRAVRGVSASRLVVLGKSLGGGIACDLTSHAECAAVILQSTFTSIPDMAGEIIPVFPAGWFVSSSLDNRSKIDRISAPKLFIHSRADEMVPFAMSQVLFDAAREPKEFVAFEDSLHNNLVEDHEAALIAAYREFIATHVARE
jgi:fermentation-respiration switch protein FrsA (DUF1100 family)